MYFRSFFYFFLFPSLGTVQPTVASRIFLIHRINWLHFFPAACLALNVLTGPCTTFLNVTCLFMPWHMLFPSAWNTLIFFADLRKPSGAPWFRHHPLCEASLTHSPPPCIHFLLCIHLYWSTWLFSVYHGLHICLPCEPHSSEAWAVPLFTSQLNIWHLLGAS